MKRITRKQLIEDLSFLHENAASLAGGMEVPTDAKPGEYDEDDLNVADDWRAECRAAFERLMAAIDAVKVGEIRVPKGHPGGPPR